MAALLGQKKTKKAVVCWLYVCHADHSSSRGRYGIVDLSSPKCALVAALVALAGALQLAAVSAVVLLTAVVVHMAAPQGVASVPPVKTMTMSNSALTSAQPTTLHALFQLFLVHGRLHFRQAHYASQR